ncbi:MAG: RagB/SusD family nutrient uptake outer membrane protein [Ginsengibacter sp.]
MKKINTFIIGTLAIACFLLLNSCSKSILKEKLYSQLAPGNFLTTNDGIRSLLQAAYTEEGQVSGQSAGKEVISMEELTTDIMYEYGGSDNRFAIQFINFTWDPSVSVIFNSMWSRPYRAIRNANTLLDNIAAAKISDDQKNEYIAEARFIRAISYYHLYMLFGPVPLRKSTKDSLQLSRATKEGMESFIESELQAAISVLPDPGKEEAYGRATNGAARAFLCKFYLNTRQWQKCVDAAQQVMDMHKYQLYPDYFKLFHVENERNSEFIWVRQATPLDPGTMWPNRTLPPAFAKDPVTGLLFQNNFRNFGAQFTNQDGFYNSFDATDKRRTLMLSKYINTKGDTISLLNNNNNTRSLKYWPDPNAIAGANGNDIPEVRYADILLSRSEALNELQGPNQESIDLINIIRERAGLADLSLSDITSKDELRNHILDERLWEFYSEGLRRQDLIRMDKFIQNAHDRGHANAKDYMKVFPIPQQAMDANPKLVQSPGY